MMRNWVLAGVVLASCAVAMGDAGDDDAGAPPQGVAGRNLPGSLAKLKRLTWVVDGVTREALVYVPANVAEGSKPPLVFGFHGHGGRAELAAWKFRFHELWPEAVCVYPTGLPTPAPAIDPQGKRNGWQKYIGDEHDRDLAFYDAMLKTMKKDYHIDDKRVYVCGHSNGGFFAYTLWAARGNTIAAIAPISADQDVRDMSKDQPMPVLHVAGENDPLVKFATQELSMEADRKIDGCDAAGKPAGKYCTEYDSKTGVKVITFIHPGGHGVPEGAPERIIAFFKAIGGK